MDGRESRLLQPVLIFYGVINVVSFVCEEERCRPWYTIADSMRRRAQMNLRWNWWAGGESASVCQDIDFIRGGYTRNNLTSPRLETKAQN